MANKIKEVIKFSASWCGPCKAYGPIFEKVSKNDELKDIKFTEMDVESDEATPLVEKYGIKGVPATMIVDENREPIKQVLGPIPETNLIELIKGEMV